MLLFQRLSSLQVNNRQHPILHLAHSTCLESLACATLHCPCFSSVALAVKEMLWSWHQMLHTSSCLPLFMIANGVWSVALHPDCQQNKTLAEEFACILPTTTRLAVLAAGFFNKYKGEWIIKEVLCLVERGERGGGMTTAATTTTHLGSSWGNQALAKEVIV